MFWGHRSNLKNQNFQILLAIVGLFTKMYGKMVFFLSLFSDENTFKLNVEVTAGKVNLPNSHQKVEAHFLIILFCKESKLAIRIWPLWVLRVDLLWTLTPQNMAYRSTSDHFDGNFRVPFSMCNQKLPNKLNLYEFDVFTGRSTLGRCQMRWVNIF